MTTPPKLDRKAVVAINKRHQFSARMRGMGGGR